MTATRLRVLHVGKYYPPHKGGLEYVTAALCKGLRRWVDIEVIVANENRHTVKEIVEGVPVTRLATLLHAASTPICPGFFTALRKTSADIIHLHVPNPLATLALLASGQRAPLVVTYHSDIVRQKFLALAFEPFSRKLLSRCAVIAPTSLNYLKSSPVLSALSERCRVIPLGIDSEEFERADAAAVAALRERYGPRIILGVGRLIYYKGFEHLIKAMSQVDGKLLIIGEGPLRPVLAALARDYGVSQRVFLLGEIEDVRPFYHAADIFVLSSTHRAEAFGVVQLEAMACRKPVVNTSLDTGVPYLSLDGVTGLTVPPGSADALAAALNRLLNDPELRRRYGEAGCLRVKNEFTLERMLRGYLEVYGQVMGKEIDTP